MSFILESGTRFLNPERMLFWAELKPGQVVADLGTGSGFFAVAAAKIVGEGGLVFAVDIMDQALAHLASESRLQGLRNIRGLLADLETPGACQGIPAGGVDMVILANILHQLKAKEQLFQTVYGLLKTGGRAMAIEWNMTLSPIGPKASTRLSESVVEQLAVQAGLKFLQTAETDRFHYGLMFKK